MYRIYFLSNYIYVVRDGVILIETGRTNVDIKKYNVTGTSYRVFVFDEPNLTTDLIPFAQIQDQNGNAYADAATFESLYQRETGKSSGGGSGQGAVIPRAEHIFDSVTARDTYFSANPDELETGLPIFVTVNANTEYQIWGAAPTDTYTPATDAANWVEAGTFNGTAAQLATLVFSVSDTNRLTDALLAKLNGIENGATADQTGAEIVALIASESNVNLINDANLAKLNAITDTGRGQVITAAEASQIAAAINNASISGQNITFDKNDGTSIRITIPTTTTPGQVPTLPQGTLITLQSNTDNWDASSGSFPSSAGAQLFVSGGFLFRISTAGTLDGVEFTTNDLLLALIDNPSTSTYTGNWHKIEGDGVHSWGGLTGTIDDRAIDTKIQSLNYIKGSTVQDEGTDLTGTATTLNFVGAGVTATGTGAVKTITIPGGGTGTYAAPSVHNLSINIPSRVDLNTDLNNARNVTFSITNRQNITSLQLIVTTGTNVTLTNPTIDGIQTQSVTLSSINTSAATTVTFQLRITDTQGNTHDSNIVTITVADLQPQEQTHFGFVQSTQDESDIVFATSDIEARDQADGTWTVSGIPVDSNLYRIYWAVPTNEGSITSVFQGGFNITNQFTSVTEVTIEGETYSILIMNIGSAVNSNYNGTILTTS